VSRGGASSRLVRAHPQAGEDGPPGLVAAFEFGRHYLLTGVRAQDDGEEVFALGAGAIDAGKLRVTAATVRIRRLFEGDVELLAGGCSIDEVLGDGLAVLPAGGQASVRQHQQSHPYSPLRVPIHAVPLGHFIVFA
jgi:hypothetical protein